MSFPIQFLYMVMLCVFAAGKVTIQGAASRRHIHNAQDSVLFNVFFFGFVAIALAILFPRCPLNMELFWWSLVIGVFMMIFQTVYAIALNCGPVSLTVLIVNFQVLFTTGVSIAVFKDTVYLFQVLGIGFLVLSMLLSVKKSGNEKITTRWLLLAIGAFLSCGCSSALQKLFMLTDSSKLENGSTTFLLVLYIVSAGLGLVYYAVRALTGKKEKCTFFSQKSIKPILLFAGGMGLLIAVYQKLYMYGLQQIDGTFFFPTYSGLSSFFMSIIGLVFFKDKLSRKQKWGIVCGIISIALMNLRLGMAF